MLYDFLKIKEPQSLKEIKSWIKRYKEIDFSVLKTVSEIIEEVKKEGDRAVLKYSRKFDGINARSVQELKVGRGEIDSAGNKVRKKNSKLVEALEASYVNIRQYHLTQFKKEPKSWYIYPIEGKKIGQILTPIERVGIYIPGGRYLYPSSVLMAAIPAVIAGVKEIVVCTPPQKDGNIDDIFLYLFAKLGISEVYKIGGAQAVAALAYGTESIKKVDKIVGPGNAFVTAAKKLVFGTVGIDSLAGPSEIVIIVDDKDRMNVDILVSSLQKNCKIFFNSSLNFIVDICNLIAPEHLEIMTADNEKVLEKIKNAGAIFVGDYTPVAIGDYIGGTNHIIPTGGNARFSSPLGVYDFLKKSSVTFYDYNMLKKEKEFIETLSDFENLLAHNNSIKVRFADKLKKEIKNKIKKLKQVN
jgi:histidinol dehydrogenase